MERCTIEALPVGARLAEPVRADSGRLVFQAGTIVHPSQREILKRMGVASVLVHEPTRPAAPAPPPAETDGAVYRRLDEIRPGSVVLRPVVASDGRTLLQVGTRLSARYAETLVRHGVEGIWLREPAGQAEAAQPRAAEDAAPARPAAVHPGGAESVRSAAGRAVDAEPARMAAGRSEDGGPGATAVGRFEDAEPVQPAASRAAYAGPGTTSTGRSGGPAEPARPAASAPEPARRTEPRLAAEPESSEAVPGISSFRLERVALALAAAHKTLAGLPEEKAALSSAVLFDAGAAVVGEIKTSWRRPFMIEKITADQPYHLVHPIRSALLAVRLGTATGLRDADLVRLGTAAVLMDVGMALLPGSPTSDVGELDDATRGLVQRHPQIGAQLLRRSGYEESLGQIVLEHHESWSGDGYPSGKSGNGIFRSARLLNLAMSYVALISDRPYRPAYLPHEAFEFLLAYAGDQFDPALVDTLIRTVPPYPAGARVLLDGDAPATVVDPQIGQLARPIVRLDDGTVVDMGAPGHLNRFVVGVVSAPTDDAAPWGGTSR